MYETVRHALSDFSLLSRWDEFDSAEALFGDLPDEAPDPDDDDVEWEKYVRLTCPFLFILDAADVDTLVAYLQMSIALHELEPDTSVEEISVTLEIEMPDD